VEKVKKEKWQYHNKRGREVGWVQDGIFHSTRDYNRGQIFKKPKYKSALAIDRSILKDLVAKQVKLIKILVKNFEPTSFWVQIDVQHFLKNSFEIDFKRKDQKNNATPYGAQRGCPMKFWTRIYPGQVSLDIYHGEAMKEGIL